MWPPVNNELVQGAVDRIDWRRKIVIVQGDALQIYFKWPGQGVHGDYISFVGEGFLHITANPVDHEKCPPNDFSSIGVKSYIYFLFIKMLLLLDFSFAL